MANPFAVNVAGGYDLGQGLNQLGQILRQNRLDQNKQQQQEQLQQLRVGAAQGDPNALNQLMAYDPQTAQALQKQQQQTQERATADFLLNYRAATDPEQKQAMLADAQTSGLIDEEDMQFIDNEDVQRAFFNRAYGQQFASDVLAPEVLQDYSHIVTTENGDQMGLNKVTQKYELIEAPAKVRKATPMVQVGAGEKSEAAESGKIRAKNFSAVQTAGSQARKQKRTLNILKSLNDKAFEGRFADAELFAKGVANAIGFDVEGLPETEIFNALANDLMLGKTSQLSGALSDKDIDFLKSTVPQLNQMTEGRRMLINIMSDLADLEIDYARKAAEYKKKNNGTFDQLGFEDYVAEQYGNKNQLSKYFTGDSGSDYTDPTIGDYSQQELDETAAQYGITTEQVQKIMSGETTLKEIRQAQAGGG